MMLLKSKTLRGELVNHGVSQYRVLLSTSDTKLEETLRKGLPPDEFELTFTLTVESISLLHRVIDEAPDILIFELQAQDDSPDVMISTLKKLRPNLKIIVVSPSPSYADAKVVEQGIFYYMAKPESEELVQVVHAAAKALEHSHVREGK